MILPAEMSAKIRFSPEGLIPVILQHFETLQVLTLAYMNRESFDLTMKTGDVWFYSRSRQKLWHKGESSGNFQRVKKVYWDCDQDALLVQVQSMGPACHTGQSSCFFEALS